MKFLAVVWFFVDEFICNWLLLKGSVVSCVGSTSLPGDFHLPLPDSTGFMDLETDILVHFSVEHGGFWPFRCCEFRFSTVLEFRILRLSSQLTFRLCLEVCWCVVEFGDSVLSFDCHLSPWLLSVSFSFHLEHLNVF